jgi:type IV fimbrial biogenesis protein FimT
MGMRTRRPGLTLVEIAGVVAITTAVLTILIPSLRLLLAGAQRTALLSELTGALLYARREAVERSLTVSICPSDDGSQCAAGPSPDWSRGWLLFVDENADRVRDADEMLLRVHRIDKPQFSLTGSGGMERGASFRASGLTDHPGQLEYREAEGAVGFHIELNALGRIKAA